MKMLCTREEERERGGEREGQRKGGRELDRLKGCKCQSPPFPRVAVQAGGICLLFGMIGYVIIILDTFLWYTEGTITPTWQCNGTFQCQILYRPQPFTSDVDKLQANVALDFKNLSLHSMSMRNCQCFALRQTGNLISFL